MMSDSIVFVDDSPIHGKGLFAKTFISSGSVIGVVQGQPTTTDGAHVLWIDENKGFHVQCDMRYINHSDFPNAAYYDSLEVCAMRDIQAGEEITHNYGAGWEE
jgi:SET domain-containing protein